jgi:hypothetical protein
MIDSAAELHGTAERISMATQHPKVVRYANEAMKNAVNASNAHDIGDYSGASAYFAEAVSHLQNAALLHTGKMGLGEFASPEVLDAAHLGKGQELHQNYLDEINEGTHNGR